MFVKQSPSEIISLNFEKKTVNYVIHARAVECSV